MPINYDSVMQGFISESIELLDRAETCSLELENGVSDSLVNDIFRAMHTIKGNSGLFDLPGITTLAHSIESLLNQIRAREIPVDITIVDIILTGIDRLRSMIGDTQLAASMDNSDLISRLKKLLHNAEQGPSDEIVDAIKVTQIEIDSAEDSSKERTEKKKIIIQTSSATAANEAKKDAPSPNGDRKPSFRIPGKFIRMAHDTGKFLSLVYLDLKQQENPGLASIAERIEKIGKESLLMCGPRKEKLGDACEVFPFFLLILSEGHGDEYIASFNLKGKTKMLYEPDGNKEVSDVSAGGAAADPSKKIIRKGSALQSGSSPVSTVQAEEKQNSENQESALKTEPEEKTEIIPEFKEMIPPSSDQTSSEKKEVEAPRGMGSAGAETHLKVPVSLIDSLINLAGETVIARNEMAQRISKVRDSGLDMIGKRMSQLITRMQEGIMRTRLQELNIVFQRLPRLVRDVSRVTGKNIDLVVAGGEVELDKSMIDVIGDSLMHMIRNSIDHGIESPDERKKAGKKEKGLVKVSAHLRGGNVVLMVADDGKGLNKEKIKEKAIMHNLISREESVHLPAEQVYDLIFHPGLSTADKVTSTSGRGVGMDVVRSGIKKHGGNVEVISEEGKGTTFIASIPQTLSIVSCLLVRSGNAIFALPQQNLKELILVEPEKVGIVEDHKVYQLRGHLLPLVELEKMLDIPGDSAQGDKHIAVVHSERHYFGIVVDEVVNLEEIVIKRLGEHFRELTFFAGAAIMGDGEAILVLDVPGIAKYVNLQAGSMEDQIGSEDEGEEDVGYLVFSAASQNFAVPVATVPRIEKIGDSLVEDFMGREVVKYRDEVVPVIRLESVYDLQDAKKARGDYYLIIFNVNGVRSGIVADEIHNVVRELPNLDTKKFTGDSVLGHSILNGETTLIIDAVELIETLAESRFKNINKFIIMENEEVLEEV